MIDLKQKTNLMQYNPQILVHTVFNQVEYLLEYGELVISSYTQIHTTNIAYTIITRTKLKSGTG